MKLLEAFDSRAGAAAVVFVGAIFLGAVLTACPRDGELTDAERTLQEGRETFRYDTFGNRAFWGDTLRLHEAILGEDNGGVGDGVSPNTALGVGLKVDVEALSPQLREGITEGTVDLDDPATTVVLLQRNAVVGLTGFFDGQDQLTSLGIQCALCHSDVDDSFAPGIGHRLDGWANRDLNVGAIFNLSPDLTAIADILDVDEATVRDVVTSWGPGKFDALLLMDGKAFQPGGESGATLIPPAFGLAGTNLHTWTGFGSVPYWNAFVAVLEMQGQGTFFDPRLNDPVQFPVAAANGFYDVRPEQDLVTPKLPALHFYQLSLEAPTPPAASFNSAAAARGETLFIGKAACDTCHVPPLYVEPGWHLHQPEEIGIDAFQADRSPEHAYRTPPLKGLWSHTTGGFFHDGRFETLQEVIQHYNTVRQLGLTTAEINDLEQFLLSL